MKRLVVASLAVLVVLLAVCGGTAFWFLTQLSPVNPGDSTPVNYFLVTDRSATQIFTDLHSRHLLRSVLVARVYARVYQLDRKLVPGAHTLAASQSTPDILKTLTRQPEDIRITFPEGWRREQYAARLSSFLTGPSARFNAAEFLALTVDLEGRLYPDTYLIPVSATAEEVIAQLTQNFRTKTADFNPPAAEIVIASLVEREVRHPSDLPLVAGIILQRLQADWPLQIDATVQYAEGSARCLGKPGDCSWWLPVTSTQTPSLYNTYLHPHLPPTAICNPGLPALQAAHSPQTSDYLYYLTDPSGVTHYAKTLDEHARNVRLYLQ